MTTFILLLAIAGGVAFFLVKQKKGSTAAPQAAAARPESDFNPGKTLIEGLSQKINITYKDRDGEITKRDITLKSVHGETRPFYMAAYCHLRNEPRYFRVDEVLEIMDTNTGEIGDQDQFKVWIESEVDRLRKETGQTRLRYRRWKP